MNQERKQLIVFGYGLAVILSFIGLRLWAKGGGHTVSFVLLGTAGVVAVLTAWNVLLLKPFYQRWMTAAHFLGTVITGAVLAIIFYSVFAGVGVILRLLGKDLLDREINDNLNSYWREKKKVPFNRADYTRQF